MRPFSALCLAFLLAATPSFAEDPQALQRKLTQLKKEIQQVQSRLTKERKAASSVAAQLAETEVQIGQLGKQLAGLDAQLGNLTGDLEKHESERDALLDQLERSKTQLMQLLRQRHRMGEQGRLQLLLTQQDPELLARLNHYYSDFTQAQAKALAHYQTLLSSLQSARQAVGQTQQSILDNRASVEQKLNQQKALKASRAQQLQAMRKEISGQEAQLKRWQADQKRMEKLLADLEKAVSVTKIARATAPFSQSKGRLQKPIPGKVLRGFGSTEGNIVFDGLLLSGKVGEAVYATHPGRVVYSDWFQGYGLLLIVDHGGGYMSLYGHNESLLSEVGDWVAQGERIALVGQSGGHSEPGLYFAIRHNGKAVDPIVWLSR